MEDAPLYNRFLEVPLSHTLNDGLTSDTYSGNTHLIKHFAILGSLSLVSHHFNPAQAAFDTMCFDYIHL